MVSPRTTHQQPITIIAHTRARGSVPPELHWTCWRESLCTPNLARRVRSRRGALGLYVSRRCIGLDSLRATEETPRSMISMAAIDFSRVHQRRGVHETIQSETPQHKQTAKCQPTNANCNNNNNNKSTAHGKTGAAAAAATAAIRMELYIALA